MYTAPRFGRFFRCIYPFRVRDLSLTGDYDDVVDVDGVGSSTLGSKLSSRFLFTTEV